MTAPRITVKPGNPSYLSQTFGVWTAGANAARAGQPASDNPYDPLLYEFVQWMHGWAAAMHNKAKEDDEL